MKFRYSEYTATNRSKIYRPTVSIVFRNAPLFILVEAMIDSGADFTILPIEMAGALGLKLDHSKKRIFKGAGNNPFTVYPAPIKIEHILRQDGFREIKWKDHVFFAESQPAILLGQKGFLEHFRVILDGKKKETEVLP